MARSDDFYESNSVAYYAIHVFVVLYALAVVASDVLVINANIPHSFFWTVPYGTLYSERFVGRQALAIAFSGVRLFIVIAASGLLTFRKTRRGCVVLWSILIAVFVAFDAMSLSINSMFLARCNSAQPGNAGNPCNNALWCCAPEVFVESNANGCRPSSMCTLTPVTSVTELGGNADFYWTFSLNVVFVAAGLGLLMIPLIKWILETPVASSAGKRAIDDAEVMLMQTDAAPPLPPLPAAAAAVTRKRYPSTFGEGSAKQK